MAAEPVFDLSASKVLRDYAAEDGALPDFDESLMEAGAGIDGGIAVIDDGLYDRFRNAPTDEYQRATRPPWIHRVPPEDAEAVHAYEKRHLDEYQRLRESRVMKFLEQVVGNLGKDIQSELRVQPGAVGQEDAPIFRRGRGDVRTVDRVDEDRQAAREIGVRGSEFAQATQKYRGMEDMLEWMEDLTTRGFALVGSRITAAVGNALDMLVDSGRPRDRVGRSKFEGLTINAIVLNSPDIVMRKFAALCAYIINQKTSEKSVYTAESGDRKRARRMGLGLKWFQRCTWDGVSLSEDGSHGPAGFLALDPSMPAGGYRLPPRA